MATYSTSAATKTALIMAAGELFAEHGFKSVTTRAIAKKAGENIGSIKYHFNSKDGLLEAIIDFATAKWQHDPLGAYLKANENLFATTKGQSTIVVGLVDLFLELAFANDIPAWCAVLIFQILQRDLPTSKYIFDTCSVPIMTAFNTTYSRISGDPDQETAFCWTIAVVAPAHLVLVDQSVMKKIHRLNSMSDSILKKLRDMMVRNGLANLKMSEKEIERVLQ